MLFKNAKAQFVAALFFAVLGIPLDANNANACWIGVLDNVNIGDTVSSMFDNNRGIVLCGGEFKGARYLGKKGKGYVFCSYRDERMNDTGRRVLVINGTVVASKEGGGNIDRCSWDDASR